MKVALFIPCYVDQFYPQVAIATLQLLEKFGVEVVYPMQQTCCGQPMANSGYEHLTGNCKTKAPPLISLYSMTEPMLLSLPHLFQKQCYVLKMNQIRMAGYVSKLRDRSSRNFNARDVHIFSNSNMRSRNFLNRILIEEESS